MLAIIVAILTTLVEFPEGTPESNLYLLCNTDLQLWEKIKKMLLDEKLILIKGHWVTLTEKGIKTGTEMDKALKERTNV